MCVAGIRVESGECMWGRWCSGEEPEGRGLGRSGVAVVRRHYNIRSSDVGRSEKSVAIWDMIGRVVFRDADRLGRVRATRRDSVHRR